MATFYFLLSTFYFPLVYRAAKVRFSSFPFSIFSFHKFRRFSAVVGDDLQEVDAGVEGGGVDGLL